MGLECPMCGLSETYIKDDPVTPGKKWCKGCGSKFMPTGSMYKQTDSALDDIKYKKEVKDNGDKPSLRRG